MNNFGFYIMILGFVLSLHSSLFFFLGNLKNNKILIISAQRSFYLVIAMVSITSFSLIYSFLTNDFSNIYVANHSSLDMNRALTLVAFYSGNEGSLMYILFVHVILSGIMYRFAPSYIKNKLNISCSILAIITSFYLFVMIFFANPFQVSEFIPNDGKDNHKGK